MNAEKKVETKKKEKSTWKKAGEAVVALAGLAVVFVVGKKKD